MTQIKTGLQSNFSQPIPWSERAVRSLASAATAITFSSVFSPRSFLITVIDNFPTDRQSGACTYRLIHSRSLHICTRSSPATGGRFPTDTHTHAGISHYHLLFCFYLSVFPFLSNFPSSFTHIKSEVNLCEWYVFLLRN